MGISVDSLADAVMKQMTEYRNLATDQMKKAVKKAGKTVQSEIEARAPVRTGRYAASWESKTTSESSYRIEVTVSSKSWGRLSHLLENGHAKRGGKGRVRAFPHIGPAEEIGEAQLKSDIMNALKG